MSQYHPLLPGRVSRTGVSSGASFSSKLPEVSTQRTGNEISPPTPRSTGAGAAGFARFARGGKREASWMPSIPLSLGMQNGEMQENLKKIAKR